MVAHNHSILRDVDQPRETPKKLGEHSVSSLFKAIVIGIVNGQSYRLPPSKNLGCKQLYNEIMAAVTNGSFLTNHPS